MYKFTFFVLILLSFLKINAQVTAGIHDNLIIGQQEVYLVGSNIQPDIQYDFFDSLDLNADGQFDVLFHLSAAKTSVYKGAYSEITAMHPGFEFVTSASGKLARLSAGAAIGPANTWGQGTGQILSKSYDLGVYQQSGNWVGNSFGYAGFRISTTQDTFYGWLPVNANVNANIPTCQLQIYSNWAIEPEVPIQFDNFVVAGDTSGLISGLETKSMHQGPVPFGGGDGIVDSLDLNEDGIFDVAFGVAVCNTFDCLIGQSYLAGMHTGFNFVNGPSSVRRFDLGDTIGSIANWNFVSNNNNFSEFISDGSGFNGAQSSGEWLNNYFGYFAFRLITPASDTLLGWVHVFTYSLSENGAHLEVDAWAIQPDPSKRPVVALSLIPQKNAYCPGDTLLFQASTAGAAYTKWHFWDGSSDTSAIVTRILPDSTVTVTFEAGNDYGVTLKTQTLQVTPLLITAPDIILDCTNPVGTLSVSTNHPADFWWVIGTDTLAGPTPPAVHSAGPIYVIAQDANGCTASTQIEILLDINVPVAMVEYDEANQLLIAYSTSPGVTFQWTSDNAPGIITGDSLFIFQSGVYTLTVLGSNGCTASESISITLTSAAEPIQEVFRIQPNPAGAFIRLENGSPLDLNFSLMDVTGRIQLTKGLVQKNSALQLGIESLPAGVYLINACETNGKSSIFKRFIKI